MPQARFTSDCPRAFKIRSFRRSIISNASILKMLRLKRSHPVLWLWKLPSSKTNEWTPSRPIGLPRKANTVFRTKQEKTGDRMIEEQVEKESSVARFFLGSLLGHSSLIRDGKAESFNREILWGCLEQRRAGWECFYGVFVCLYWLDRQGLRRMSEICTYIIEYECSGTKKRKEKKLYSPPAFSIAFESEGAKVMAFRKTQAQKSVTLTFPYLKSNAPRSKGLG